MWRRYQRRARALSKWTPGRRWIGRLRDRFLDQGIEPTMAKFRAESISAVLHALVIGLLAGALTGLKVMSLEFAVLLTTSAGIVFEAYAIGNYFTGKRSG
jgi:hypothetical protein